MPSPRSRALPLLLAAAVALVTGWRLAAPASRPGRASAAARLDARAAGLARDLLVVDTHIDLPYRLEEHAGPREDVSQRTPGGDFDAVRARQGGLDVAWMSIYVPSSLQTAGGARDLADSLIDLVEGLAAEHPGTFAVARGADEAEAIARSGRIALPLGIENAAAFEADLANVAHFHGRGVRYATLVHAEDNLICDSSYSDAQKRTWRGLSPFGAQVVAEMNRLGIMVDISHVSDECFDAVLAATTAPVIASHSSCRHFTPGFERNLDDGRIRRLAENGGVIQINFGSGFLTAPANEWSSAAWDAEQAFRTESGAREGSPELAAWRARYQEGRPFPRASVDDVVAHIEHVIALAGVDHVGLGSDFEGVGPTTPSGLEDVSKYPNLFAKLLERGHSEAAIEKIAGGNLMRVWRAVEARARQLQLESTPGAPPPEAR